MIPVRKIDGVTLDTTYGEISNMVRDDGSDIIFYDPIAIPESLNGVPIRELVYLGGEVQALTSICALERLEDDSTLANLFDAGFPAQPINPDWPIRFSCD